MPAGVIEVKNLWRRADAETLDPPALRDQAAHLRSVGNRPLADVVERFAEHGEARTRMTREAADAAATDYLAGRLIGFIEAEQAGHELTAAQTAAKERLVSTFRQLAGGMETQYIHASARGWEEAPVLARLGDAYEALANGKVGEYRALVAEAREIEQQIGSGTYDPVARLVAAPEAQRHEPDAAPGASNRISEDQGMVTSSTERRQAAEQNIRESGGADADHLSRHREKAFTADLARQVREAHEAGDHNALAKLTAQANRIIEGATRSVIDTATGRSYVPEVVAGQHRAALAQQMPEIADKLEAEDPYTRLLRSAWAGHEDVQVKGFARVIEAANALTTVGITGPDALPTAPDKLADQIAREARAGLLDLWKADGIGGALRRQAELANSGRQVSIDRATADFALAGAMERMIGRAVDKLGTPTQELARAHVEARKQAAVAAWKVYDTSGMTPSQFTAASVLRHPLGFQDHLAAHCVARIRAIAASDKIAPPDKILAAVREAALVGAIDRKGLPFGSSDGIAAAMGHIRAFKAAETGTGKVVGSYELPGKEVILDERRLAQQIAERQRSFTDGEIDAAQRVAKHGAPDL